MCLNIFSVQGFWLREATYREQPTVAFKKDFILVLDMQETSGSVTTDTIKAYSTFQQYNQLISDNLRIPVTKVLIVAK